jgi:HEPN domain-containing protein
MTDHIAEAKTVQEKKWIAFAKRVTEHIKSYVIPQYGDEGEEPAQEYDAADCVKQAQRYLARFGKSQRPGEELRDLYKSAHWIQKAEDRLRRAEDNFDGMY